MDDRARRVGENEALFRHVNERIEDVNRTFAALTSTMDIVCECGSGSCVERIAVDIADYERVRADSRHFLVLPGHEVPDVEDVVERNPGWVVVRKAAGDVARLAEETDPRS